MTPGWHISLDLNFLYLKIVLGASSRVSSNKFVTIMVLQANQLQVKTNNPQANAIIERVHKLVVCQ
jgi:hypothetical protein